MPTFNEEEIFFSHEFHLRLGEGSCERAWLYAVEDSKQTSIVNIISFHATPGPRAKRDLTRLFEVFKHRLADRGIKEIRLKSYLPQREDVIEFYKQLGFRQTQFPGSTMQLFIYSIQHFKNLEIHHVPPS